MTADTKIQTAFSAKLPLRDSHIVLKVGIQYVDGTSKGVSTDKVVII